MKSNLILLICCFLLVNSTLSGQVADFVIPDTVCINDDISIQNTSVGGSSYYWNFCSGNLAQTPIGINLGNTGSLNGPVYSAIANDNGNYYVFITNVNDGTLSRLSFGNSLINVPVSTNLGTLGVLLKNIEGIQIKKDNVTGNWAGLIAGGENRFLVKLNFGNNLNNTPVAINLGNTNNQMSYSHTIYTFNEGGNWYSLIGNSDLNTIIRLNFGNSLDNAPASENLGNVGGLNGPVGFYPVMENGNYYLFVVNKNSNTLSRLNFGNSLANIPTGKNIGNVGGTMKTPRSISIIRDCGQVFGFVVNEATNDIVRLSFPSGILGSPQGVSLGNIATFAFPHHISELFRVGDSLYTFIMNVNNSTISRLCFPNCNNASISSSTLQNPPAYSYNVPGFYNISLIVNEGMPTQANICKEVFVLEVPAPAITGDTLLCVGDTLKLISDADPGYTFEWSGPNGFVSADPNLLIPGVDTSYSGQYTLVLKQGKCKSDPVSNMVSVAERPVVDLGEDTIVCPGTSFELNAANPGSGYLWNTGADTQTIQVENPGNYSVNVTNGACSVSDEIFIDDCGYDIFLPDAFTPDNDNINDRFRPKISGVLNFYKMTVFNRWGQMIFQSNDALYGWDGTFQGVLCPAGVYVYSIEYSFGTDLSDFKQMIKRGTVTLLN